MKVQIEKLEGVPLSWAAAVARGLSPVIRADFLQANGVTHPAALTPVPQIVVGDESLSPLARLRELPHYEKDWLCCEALPVVKDLGINLTKVGEEGWIAKTDDLVEGPYGLAIFCASGTDPAMAIARCFVYARLGYEVEIPEVLS